jgi:hypothetical protein
MFPTLLMSLAMAPRCGSVPPIVEFVINNLMQLEAILAFNFDRICSGVERGPMGDTNRFKTSILPGSGPFLHRSVFVYERQRLSHRRGDDSPSTGRMQRPNGVNGRGSDNALQLNTRLSIQSGNPFGIAVEEQPVNKRSTTPTNYAGKAKI